MKLEVGSMVKFVYDDKVFEGSVEKLAVSKKGVEYMTAKVADIDVKEMVFRSFHLGKMQSVQVS
jgi:hypothetical protein